MADSDREDDGDFEAGDDSIVYVQIPGHHYVEWNPDKTHTVAQATERIGQLRNISVANMALQLTMPEGITFSLDNTWRIADHYDDIVRATTVTILPRGQAAAVRVSAPAPSVSALGCKTKRQTH